MAKVDIWMPVYIGDYLRDTMRLTTEGERSLLTMLGDTRGYLILGSAQFREDYNHARRDFERDLKEMHRLSVDWSLEEQARLTRLTELHEEWVLLSTHLLVLRDDTLNNEPALRILTMEGEVPMSIILSKSSSILWHQARREPSTVNMELLKDIAEFQSSFGLMVSSLRGYLATNNPMFKDEYELRKFPISPLGSASSPIKMDSIRPNNSISTISIAIVRFSLPCPAACST